MKKTVILLEPEALVCPGDRGKFESAGYVLPDECASPWALERLAEICRQTGARVVVRGDGPPNRRLPGGGGLLEAMAEKGIQAGAAARGEVPAAEGDADIYIELRGGGQGLDDSLAKELIFRIRQQEAERDCIYKAVFTPGAPDIARDIMDGLPGDFKATGNSHVTLQFRDAALTDMPPARLEDGVTAEVVIDGWGYDRDIGVALHVSGLVLAGRDGAPRNVRPLNGHELHITLATAPGVKPKDAVELFRGGREYHKFSEPVVISGAEYGIFTKKQQTVTYSSIRGGIEEKYPREGRISARSTDAERAAALGGREITICQSRRSLLPPVYDETERRSIMDVTRAVVSSLHIDSSTYRLEGFPKEVALTNESIKKSFNIMGQRHTDTKLFPEALTVLSEICQNAVLIQIEGDAKANKESHKGVRDVYHWMSAFHDGEKIYPVKLTVEDDKSRDPDKIYFLLTLGETSDISSPIYKKEAANTDLHPGAGEGPSVGRASFKCSITQFISNFNGKHGILLKHFPDSMLSERQRGIKQAVIAHDSRIATDAGRKRSAMSRTGSSVQKLLDKVRKALSVSAEKLGGAEGKLPGAAGKDVKKDPNKGAGGAR